MIIDNLKEIINLKDIIKTDELHYKSKHRKTYNFSDYDCVKSVRIRSYSGLHFSPIFPHSD